MVVLALAMLSMVFAPSVRAAGVEAIVSLDKSLYKPGEHGTISIVMRNTLSGPVEIENVTIVFSSWRMYTADGWDELGNFSVVYDEVVTVGSKNGTLALDPIDFTVPDDRRAGISTNVAVSVYTSEGYRTGAEYVDVLGPREQISLRALDNIVMLLTVIAILAIVSAIIIAAAVFLSGRRPGVMS